MEQNRALYIADITMKIVDTAPATKFLGKYQLPKRPVCFTANMCPMVLVNENGAYSIPLDVQSRVFERVMDSKDYNYNPKSQRITYELSNVKFSSKIYVAKEV